MTESSNGTRKHILLYGLSANPPTGDGGHRGIVTYLVNHSNDENNKFNQIWILPVYKHAFNSKSNLLDYDHRMEMCRLNFEDLSKGNGSNSEKCKVYVSDYERTIKNQLLQQNFPTNNMLGTISKNSNLSKEFIGTVDVLVQLKREHLDTDFSFGMGHDTYFDLLNGLWKGGQRIFDEVKHLYVINREGAVRANKKLNGSNFKKLNVEGFNLSKVINLEINGLTDISSSKIRKQFFDLKKLLLTKVSRKSIEIKFGTDNQHNSKFNNKVTDIFTKLNEGLYEKVLIYIMNHLDVYEYYTN
jgi:nicotinic acid mononucleotide adenylyltransferase